MPPVKTREPLIEEKVFRGIARGWAYLVYAIRQIIIFFPCLWAGYEYGRRKEERMRKEGEHGGGRSGGKDGKVGLCAMHGVNWTEVEKIWEMDCEMEDAMESIWEALILIPNETNPSSQ